MHALVQSGLVAIAGYLVSSLASLRLPGRRAVHAHAEELTTALERDDAEEREPAALR